MKDKLLKLKELIKEHKKLSIISIIVVIMLCVVSITIYNQIQSNKQMKKVIVQMETDRKNKELKENLNKIVEDYRKESKAETDKLSEDFNKLTLLVYDEKEISSSNGYYEIQVTVENLSEKDVTYAKISLNFKNENDEIIQSDTIIDNNVIKSRAKQTLTKKVPDTIKYKTIDSEVLDVKY